MKIERDVHGKTRVAKGDKSGFGGRFAPDIETLKRLSEQARKSYDVKRNDLGGLTVKEYEEAVESREILREYFSSYNKEQAAIARSFADDDTIEQNGVSYAIVFSPDVTYEGRWGSEGTDGQPKGWQLRVGNHYSHSSSGLQPFATREEAIAAIPLLEDSLKNNKYVQEQATKYNLDEEMSKGVILSVGTAKGPWNMHLRFLTPKPHMTEENKNGYNAGWCVVCVSDNYNGGGLVFVNPNGYETREEAQEALNQTVDSMKDWDGKERAVHVEGKGNILYSSLNTEGYERITSHYGFKPRPWMNTDELIDYYPKSNYPGD